MNSARYESPRITQIEKIKYLADEMAKRKVQLNHEEEETKEDNIFHKIMFAQTPKHKSQIFFNRHKKKMLNYFSLNKGSNDELDKLKNNLEKKGNNGKRHQSTIQMNKKNIKRLDSNKSDYKNYVHHYSLNNQKNLEGNNKEKEEEPVYDDKITDYNFDSNFEDNEDEDENEELNDEEEYSNCNNRENKSNNNIDKEKEQKENIKKKENEKYEIKYVNPREVKIIYDKENSPIYNPINNTFAIKNKYKDKNRYLFDKEMKLLKIKNNKIEKKRQIIEKKNQDFFQVSNFLNKNSMKIVNNNPDYRPIQYNAIEVYKHHLAKIEINQTKKNVKKNIEYKKDIKKCFNFHKLHKKNYSQSGWEEFVEQENYWQEEKKKAIELLRYKIKNQIKDKPNINRKSIIIFEKINKRNTNKNNIFLRLYNAQEIYNHKINIKRQESMPTFKPNININKFNNKSKKYLKYLNNNNFIYEDDTSSLRIKKNNQNKYLNSLNFEHKINKNFIKTPNNNFYNNSESIIYPSNITNIYIPNKNKKKAINVEYNIDMIINKSPKSMEKRNKMFCKDIKKIGFNFNENKKENKDNELEKRIKKNFKNMNFKKNIIKKDKIKKLKEEKDFLFDELKNSIINTSYDNNIKNNDGNRLLYNLNIRDNTSNTIRENIVLTSYKYRDFFNLKK